MFYKGDSVYLYIVDFGSEFNGFGFLASDNGAMVFTLIIMVIILLVLTPVGIVVDKKIEAYFENKREP